MDKNLSIALLCGLINMGLSTLVPCLLNKTKTQGKVMNQIKSVFEANRQAIIVSSVIVAITAYLALELSPELEEMMSPTPSNNMMMPMGISNFPELRNLIKLNQY